MGKAGRHRIARPPRKRHWVTISLSVLAGFALCVGVIIGVAVLVPPVPVQDPVPANLTAPPPHIDPTTTPEAIAYLDALKREHLKPMAQTDLVTIGLGVCVQRTHYNVSHAMATLNLAASRKDLTKLDAATIVNKADEYLCQHVP